MSCLIPWCFWEADQEISCSQRHRHTHISSLECLSESWWYWCEAFPDSSSTVAASPRCLSKNQQQLIPSLLSARHFIYWNKATCASVVIYLLGIVTGINPARWWLWLGECDAEGSRQRRGDGRVTAAYGSNLTIILTCAMISVSQNFLICHLFSVSVIQLHTNVACRD